MILDLFELAFGMYQLGHYLILILSMTLTCHFIPKRDILTIWCTNSWLLNLDPTFEMSFCGFEPQYSVVIHSASSLQIVFNCFLDWIITNMQVTRPFVWTLHLGTKDSHWFTTWNPGRNYYPKLFSLENKLELYNVSQTNHNIDQPV